MCKEQVEQFEVMTSLLPVVDEERKTSRDNEVSRA